MTEKSKGIFLFSAGMGIITIMALVILQVQACQQRQLLDDAWNNGYKTGYEASHDKCIQP